MTLFIFRNIIKRTYAVCKINFFLENSNNLNRQKVKSFFTIVVLLINSLTSNNFRLKCKFFFFSKTFNKSIKTIFYTISFITLTPLSILFVLYIIVKVTSLKSYKKTHFNLCINVIVSRTERSGFIFLAIFLSEMSKCFGEKCHNR